MTEAGTAQSHHAEPIQTRGLQEPEVLRRAAPQLTGPQMVSSLRVQFRMRGLRFEQRMPDCTTSMLRAHGRIVEFVVAGDLLMAVQPNPVY
jgi:hypothetical protein